MKRIEQSCFLVRFLSGIRLLGFLSTFLVPTLKRLHFTFCLQVFQHTHGVLYMNGIPEPQVLRLELRELPEGTVQPPCRSLFDIGSHSFQIAL